MASWPACPPAQGHELQVRHAAAYALGDIGKDAKEAVKPLSDALEDKNADVRAEAAFALGSIGKEAKAALPELKKLTKDPNATGGEVRRGSHQEHRR